MSYAANLLSAFNEIDRIKKDNPNHDEKGQFASGSGGGGSSSAPPEVTLNGKRVQISREGGVKASQAANQATAKANSSSKKSDHIKAGLAHSTAAAVHRRLGNTKVEAEHERLTALHNNAAFFPAQFYGRRSSVY